MKYFLLAMLVTFFLLTGGLNACLYMRDRSRNLSGYLWLIVSFVAFYSYLSVIKSYSATLNTSLFYGVITGIVGFFLYIAYQADKATKNLNYRYQDEEQYD